MLHCYSMKTYSKRKNNSMEIGYEDNQNWTDFYPW
jgi:hypothetical protein